MPTYVYRCVNCDTRSEIRHSMMENPDVFCIDCDGLCTRVPQPAGISLRGRGFYKNDTATEGL